MRVLLFAIVLATTPFLSGCGDGTVKVRGSVTLDGEPVNDGSVSFQPAEGNGPSGGCSVTEGQFEVTPGLAPGKYKVSVRGGRKTGKRVSAGPPLPPGSMIDEMITVPPAGKDPEPQTIEVTAGMAPLTFELKTLPKK